MRTIYIISLAAMLIGVAGCGGGGKSGAKVFTAFSDIAPGNTYRMTGDALVTNYDTDPNSGVVTGDAPTPADARVELTLDMIGELIAAEITTGVNGAFGGQEPDVEFRTADGDTFADGDTLDPLSADFALASSVNGDRGAIVGDPVALGFEYQSFGIWATGIDVGSGMVGAASVGAPTPASAIQGLGGEATYNGKSAGFYVDALGTAYLAFADFEATLDFDDQEIAVATSNTGVVHSVTGVSMPMAGLDFAGFGPASVGGPLGGAADGTFEADIAAAGLDLSGSMNGRLYGPNGSEIGGLFGMSGDDGQYFGAVGAVD